MTGPRRRQAATAVALDAWPSRLRLEPDPMPHPALREVPPAPLILDLTPRRGRGRPADAAAVSRQVLPPPAAVEQFVQVPLLLARDRSLEPIDVLVWIWMAGELWRCDGYTGTLNLHDGAVVVGRAHSKIRESVGRLEAAGHVRVTRSPGVKSTYGLWWPGIHSLGRDMAKRHA